MHRNVNIHQTGSAPTRINRRNLPARAATSLSLAATGWTALDQVSLVRNTNIRAVSVHAHH
jgi:hypothetical protein